MPSQMLETLLSALNAIQAMPFECPASMKAEVSKVLGDLPSAAQDQMKTGSPLTIKALAGLEGERLAKLVHRPPISPRYSPSGALPNSKSWSRPFRNCMRV